MDALGAHSPTPRLTEAGAGEGWDGVEIDEDGAKDRPDVSTRPVHVVGANELAVRVFVGHVRQAVAVRTVWLGPGRGALALDVLAVVAALNHDAAKAAGCPVRLSKGVVEEHRP